PGWLTPLSSTVSPTSGRFVERFSTKTPLVSSCMKNRPSHVGSAAVTTPRTWTGNPFKASSAGSARTSAALVSGSATTLDAMATMAGRQTQNSSLRSNSAAKPGGPLLDSARLLMCDIKEKGGPEVEPLMSLKPQKGHCGTSIQTG